MTETEAAFRAGLRGGSLASEQARRACRLSIELHARITRPVLREDRRQVFALERSAGDQVSRVT